MADIEQKVTMKSRVLDRLQDPAQLRILITVVVLAVGYLAIYTPLSADVTEKISQLRRERQQAELAVAVEHLRTEYDRFSKRLPKQVDTKEWVNYVLDGIRQYPLKLTKLNCDAPTDVGPYKAVVLRLELDGEFRDMDNFLRWLESNQRLFRTDCITISPSQYSREAYTLQMTLLGVMG
jgi:Tfp pilus assembly protein PilO